MAVILVIDEQCIYARGLREFIEARLPNSRVIEAPAVSRSVCPDQVDLVLIDSQLASNRKLDLLTELRTLHPRASFALMSGSHERSDVLASLSAGFHGFIYKLDADEELLAAIRDLLSGRMYVPRWMADHDPSGSLPEAEFKMPKLTPRQHQVLPLLAQGMSNKKIATLLRIAMGTAKIHTAALLRALKARNRTEAAFVAAKVLRLSHTAENGYQRENASRRPNLLDDLPSELLPWTGSDAPSVAMSEEPGRTLDGEPATKLVGAIPWLRSKDWPRWQQIDPSIGAFDDWRERTSMAIAEAESAGMRIEAVLVDPETFLSWCDETGRQAQPTDRSAFAIANMIGRLTVPQSRLS